ncbi:fumarylacetoacetase [Abyssalbus ytuae]|uniref:fumarylacetoacetase n=1 Tax=Abyssalbus ytuae TaxID=2926907 RepID=A0A9E6ZRE0_9FLAO|nr:fumarylacetoacetase [Abyssalbus ytuae]UOB19519.1 fumarylacetoacetase [Abyssalbus ytuae]
MESWINIPEDTDFTIYNIPFGIYTNDDVNNHIATAMGNYVIDLDVLHKRGYFKDVDLPEDIFQSRFLNPFINLGKEKTNAVRLRLQKLFIKGSTLEKDPDTRNKAFLNRQDVQMLLPVNIPNYTDFYSSIEHATNVGTMFRDPENALLPNWKHLPVGYHGRASSIVVSETPIYRPKGQVKDPSKNSPDFGPTRRLDFELEMAFITGKENKLGDPVSTEEAEEYIFGFVLFNDWSARDIQVWEYVPLGPFLGKNFASSISPWVVTLEALEPFKVASPEQTPEVLPYLIFSGNKNFDINLEVSIQPENSTEKTVCHSNFKYMYWNINQQLAHHTVNGCNVKVGDMYASGTISGPTAQSYGSMLELSWKGTKPINMPDGSSRVFINDGDTVIMRGHALKNGIRVGFGEVRTKVLPAKK